MAKTSGLGDACYVDGFDLTGDINSIGDLGGGPNLWEVQGLDRLAYERQGLQKSGRIDFTSYLNTSAGQAHPTLKTLPQTDRLVTYVRGTTLGNPGACLTSKQLNYDWSRGQDGSLTQSVNAVSNQWGLEWGNMLTAGKRTDSAATPASGSTSIDTLAAASFGGQAYLHVFAFSGTGVIIKVQDSADNSAFADVAGFTFTTVSAAPTTERLQLASGATLRRYLSLATVSSGGFTSVQFAVVVIKNDTAVIF